MRKLILAIRKNPCLWKADSEEYKIVELKEAAWNAVVRECGIADVVNAKILWKRLRDGHRQAIKKNQVVRERNRARGIPHNPDRRWKYERLMEFLLPYISVNQQRTSSQRQRHEIMSFKTEYLENTSQLVPDNEDSDEEGTLTIATPSRKRENSEIINYFRSEKRRNASLDGNSKPEDSNNDHNIYVFSAVKTFFESMALMCEQLPEQMQFKVQRSVFNAVMEAREENLRLQSGNDDD